MNEETTVNSNTEALQTQITQEQPQRQETTKEEAPVQSENTWSIPDEYKDKAWAKNIKSQEDLLKSYDNAQSLIGKKTIGLPDWNDEKQVEEYFKKVVPEKYDIDVFTDDEKTIYENIYKEVGLSQYQAKKLTDKYVESMKPTLEADYGVQALETKLKAEYKDESYLKDLTKEVLGIFGKDVFDSHNINNDGIVQLFKGFEKLKQQYGVNELTANVSNEMGNTGVTIGELDKQIDASYAKIQSLAGKINGHEEKANEIKKYNELVIKRARSK